MLGGPSSLTRSGVPTPESQRDPGPSSHVPTSATLTAGAGRVPDSANQRLPLATGHRRKVEPRFRGSGEWAPAQLVLGRPGCGSCWSALLCVRGASHISPVPPFSVRDAQVGFGCHDQEPWLCEAEGQHWPARLEVLIGQQAPRAGRPASAGRKVLDSVRASRHLDARRLLLSC